MFRNSISLLKARCLPLVASATTIPKNPTPLLTPLKLTKTSFTSKRAFGTVPLPALPSREIGLHNLEKNKGSTKKRKTVGRGPGSGRGKTCGKGHKGIKARQGGKVPLYYEGGQTTFWDRLPVHITKVKKTFYDGVNLDRLQRWIDTGRIDPSKPIDMKILHDSNCCKIDLDGSGIKLMSRGSEYFRTPIKIEVARATEEAIKAIEARGGQIVCRYYSKVGMKALLKPQLLATPIKLETPRGRKLAGWYEQEKNRGYLWYKQAERLETLPEELRRTHVAPLPRPEIANVFQG